MLSQEPEGERRAKSKSVVDQLVQELGRIGGHDWSVFRDRGRIFSGEGDGGFHGSGESSFVGCLFKNVAGESADLLCVSVPGFGQSLLGGNRDT